MSLNFAPYSSPPGSPRASTSFLPKTASNASTSASGPRNTTTRPKSPWFSVGSYQSGARTADLNSHNSVSSSSYPSNDANVLWDAENGSAGLGGNSGSTTAGGAAHDQYETTFGTRVDFEAAVAYITGPLLAIVLLILETKNDYVRFHAWQSLLLGAGLAVLHLLLLWSRFLSSVLSFAEVVIYFSLAYRAFKDGDTLERYMLPRIGELAHQWTEDE